MAYYAVIKGHIVDGIAIADAPLETDGIWIDVTNMNPMPQTRWTYDGENFSPPVDVTSTLINIPEPKMEEQKIADATAAAIAKLIADGVLKQA